MPIMPVQSLDVQRVGNRRPARSPSGRRPSTRATPVACFQRSATTRCTAMPPALAIFRWRMSTSANSGASSSAPVQRVDADDGGERLLLQVVDEGRHVARVGDEHGVRTDLHEHQVASSARTRGTAAAGRRRSPCRRAGCARSTATAAARWPPCCRASAPRPWPRRWCRRCTAGRRCRRASAAPRRAPGAWPARSAALNSIASAMRHVGTIFFTYFTTTLVMSSLTSGNMSPTSVVSTVSLSDGFFSQHLLQRVGEVLQHHDDLGARIVQLVLELARGVLRVDVDHRVAGAQRAEQGHRVLQQVGHHDRHPVALAQPQRLLQVGAEVPALASSSS